MSRIFEITKQVKTYMPKADLELINRAYVFAAQAHARQRRSSGELYITHPLNVAQNLVDLKLDVPSIITGLLHDTVEDTHVTLEDIQTRFGDEIANLVDGVTKVGKIHFRSSEHQKAENFRKLIMATAQDLRVLLVKLADRLHNMNTLSVMRKDKQRRIAFETMEIYVPLAHRLGIHWIAQAMEDLAFKYIEPEACRELEEQISEKLDFFKQTKTRLEGIIQEALNRQGIEAKVKGRLKNVYSLHQKMQRKSLDFDEVYDFMAFRIVVEDTAACYHVLGIIHSLYRPVPGRFKDYIALPKANGYQSLHTAVIGPDNFRIEVQIRSESMHRFAEDGVASHWLYKSKDKPNEAQEMQGFQWLKELAETLHTVDNPGEFLENVRLDLFVKEVYVFSRDGDLFALPRGSQPLDFAYAVHTDVGNHCVGIRINGTPAEFNQKLLNGDEIDVLIDSNKTPSRAWLQWVKTSKAKQGIRQWFRVQEKESAVHLGEHFLHSALGDMPIRHDVLQFADCNDDLELKEKLGRGELGINALLSYMYKDDESVIHHKRFTESNMQQAECCYPIPGDNVVGSFVAGKGFIVHYHNCPVVMGKEASEWVDVDWKPVEAHFYKVGIEVFCNDERGSLGLVTSCLSEENANIDDLKIKQLLGTLTLIYILIEVQDRVHLAGVLKAVKSLGHVARVRRHYPEGLGSHVVKNRFDSMLQTVASLGQSLRKPFQRKIKIKDKNQ
ncbi:MAG: bifunctional (p)ppGpp synthetase/guanosine-3',5'-bis(diphosphate) 3'-pyrophosphohydrolase [Ghiorsea sp.]